MFWQALQLWVTHYILLHICSSLFSLYKIKYRNICMLLYIYSHKNGVFPLAFYQKKNIKAQA